MVIKGKSVAGAKRLAAHLARKDTNERRNEVIELRDVAAPDLAGALREMEAVATACPNCIKPFYHASLNTRAGERLSDAQRLQAIDRLEKELGLTGQPRAIVVHEKNDGREHCHVVWTRIRSDDLRAISDSHNYRKHELVARELEREFGHERVQGAHIEREGKARPERTPSHKEHQQAERTGISAKQAKEHVTGIWRATDSGKAFAEALKQSGWLLAKGDRRDFVLIDPRGGTHSLARRIDGTKAADVRARLADIDRRRLPSVAEARAQQQTRQKQQPREKEQGRAPPTPARAPQRAPEPTGGRERSRVADGMAKAAGSAAGRIGDVLFRLLMMGQSDPSPENSREERPAPRPPPSPPTPPKQANREGEERAPPPPPPPSREPPPEKQPHEREEEERSKRRQELLRDYGREVPPEIERDVAIERDRRERERER